MFFIKLLSRLPFPVLYIISDFVFYVTYYVIRYRRRLVERNLKNAFPEKSKSELIGIRKAFYRNLCDYAVEMIKLLTISKEELTERMRFSDLTLINEFSANKQSIIFLASHQFNWEWLLVSASASFPMAIDFVYQPVENGFFDRLSLQLRTRFGAHPITRDEVAREVVKRRHILRGIATVADQYPGYMRDKKFATSFLNQETVFFLGTNNLAILTQYPAIYYSVKKVGRGQYEAVPHVVAMPPHEKTSFTVIETYVRIVEKTIRENPSEWLWSHNRWKKRHLEKR